MTAQEARDIAALKSSAFLAKLLDCIKQAANNGQYEYIFVIRIPDHILDELRHLGYKIETIDTNGRTDIKISW